MKKIIHVIQANIRRNMKKEEGEAHDPTLTCKTYKKTHWFDEVTIHGPSVLKYNEKPLGCGARVWIETYAEVTGEIDGEKIRIE
jgi:hypothetical protein